MGDDSMTDMKASDRRWGLARPVVVPACTCADGVDSECPTHGTECEWYNAAHETARTNSPDVDFVHAGPDECERCRNEPSGREAE